MKPVNISYKQAKALLEAGCRDIAVHVYTPEGARRYALVKQWEPQYVEDCYAKWHFAIMTE